MGIAQSFCCCAGVREAKESEAFKGSCSCQAFRETGKCRHLPPPLGALPQQPKEEVASDSDEVPKRKVEVDMVKMMWYQEDDKGVEPRPGERCGIFLDIDGVTHAVGAYGSENGLFCKLQLLVQIAEATSCGIVLSSSWRVDQEGIQEINDRIVEARPGADHAELLDIIRKPKAPYNDFANRDSDIRYWLKLHAAEAGWGERWIALDDVDMTSSLGEAHMVATDGEVGLTPEKVSEAIHKLKQLCMENN